MWLNLSQQRIALSLLIFLISHIPLSDNFHPFLINKEFSFQETFECCFKIKLIFHLYVIKLCGQKEIALELQTWCYFLFLCMYLKNKARPLTKYAWKGSCSVWWSKGQRLNFSSISRERSQWDSGTEVALCNIDFEICSVIPHFLISREVHENFHKLASLSSNLCRGEKGRKPPESRMINWVKHCIMKKNLMCLKHVSTGGIHTCFIYYV